MKYIKLSFLVYFSFLPFYSIATHLMGGEVTYKWLGGKKYEVTAKVYRDCQGISLNSPVINVSDYNGTTIALSYTRTSIVDITIVCSDTVPKPCKPQNSMISVPGIELHTYVGIVDFASAPFNAFPNKNACKIYFSVEQCCRNGTIITTLNSGNMYIDAMLDICKSNYQNSSPQFKSINTTNAFCNVPFKQNFGAVDFTDLDSLAFELTSALNGANSPESYNGKFSKKYPMTPYCVTSGVINCKPSPSSFIGFYLDSLNGDIIFKPINCNEAGVIVVKVSEYRKDLNTGQWVLIGYVMRDLQITVFNISVNNYDPTMTLSKTYNFKTRDNHCFDIPTSDAQASGAPANNKGDRTSLSIIQMPPGATFKYLDSNAKKKTGRFCWKIQDSVFLKYKNKNKLLQLTVELRDNYCDFPSIIHKSFGVKILPPDSSGYIYVNSYNDKNNNDKKDTKESGFPVILKFKQKNYTYYGATDIDGKLKDSSGIGIVKISVASHPYYTSALKDTNLLVKMDSSHNLTYGVQQNNGIFGKIYQDANANCIFDKGELPLAGLKVFTDSNKYMGISDRNGLYYINAPKGSYNLKCDYKPDLLTVNCPSSKIISLSINGDSIYSNNDFGVSKNMNYMDVSTGISISRLRRGNNASVTFYCNNNGPNLRRNIKLFSLVNSNFDLKYKNVLFAGAGTTATINIDSILPYKTFSIKLDFIVSSANFNSGNKICFAVETDSTTLAQDTIKMNNHSKECGVVEAPHDPNEKLISIDSTRTTLDKTIDYSIYFQNTGTDTAFRIIVKDTIDTKYLVMEKFQLNWSDYPCETVISGNVINFIFDNIRLPYLSKSGDKSIAGFNFTLGLKSDVNTETSFGNKAAIYFDFEKPIFTKSAIATIVSPIVINSLKTSGTCKNESNTVYYKSNIPLDSGNMMLLEMSDNNGSFANPIVLKTILNNSSDDSIDFLLPKSSVNNAIYKLRLKSTKPQSLSIPVNGITDLKILTIPGYTVNSSLVNNTACEKDTLKLNFTNSAHLYKILKNNASLNSFSNITSYKFVLNLKDSFKIVAMDNSTGCKDTSAIYPLIHKRPIVTAAIQNRKKDYCVGDQINIKATGALYYSYFKNNTIIAGKTTASTYNSTLNTNSIYKVSGEDSNGCINTSDTLDVFANALPVAAISASSNPVCSDKSISLNFGSAPFYDLYKNSILILNKTSTSVYNIIKPIDGDKYKIIAINNNGCSNTSNELTLVVNLAPTAMISCNPNPVCPDDTALLKFGKGFNYDLYKNNIVFLSKTVDSTYQILNPLNGDKYKITAFSDKGCLANSAEINIVNNPVPTKPVITKNNNDITVNFTGTVKWYRNGILLSNTSNTITNAPGGTYRAIVTNPEGCSSSSNTFIHQNNGIDEQLTGNFKVYPNPASTELHIESANNNIESVTLLNMEGRVILNELYVSSGSALLNTSNLSSGLYLLKVIDDKGNVEILKVRISQN